jgi:hypothetical protein
MRLCDCASKGMAKKKIMDAIKTGIAPALRAVQHISGGTFLYVFGFKA